MKPYNDPLYSAQEWVLDSLRVKPVWDQNLMGDGITVRVNDPTGVDVTHPELASKFVNEASCDEYLPPSKQSNPGKEHDKGTQVASVAVGSVDNGKCSFGVAPMAVLSACSKPVNNNNAEGLFDNATDVSIHSWSAHLTATDQAALVDGTQKGRSGLGVVYVVGSGDESSESARKSMLHSEHAMLG